MGQASRAQSADSTVAQGSLGRYALIASTICSTLVVLAVSGITGFDLVCVSGGTSVILYGLGSAMGVGGAPVQISNTQLQLAPVRHLPQLRAAPARPAVARLGVRTPLHELPNEMTVYLPHDAAQQRIHADGREVGKLVGGASGALVGVSSGTVAGLVAAPFTFGLSIPAAAALGGQAGAAAGTAVGET